MRENQIPISIELGGRRFSSTDFMRSAVEATNDRERRRCTPHKVLFVMMHDLGGGDTPEQELSLSEERGVFGVGSAQLPALIVRAGDDAVRRFVEFFAATIRNRNTRAAYAQAVRQFFEWCERRGIDLSAVSPVVVAAYVEELTAHRSAPTVKQHLAAIRMLFDWLVTGHVVAVNPACRFVARSTW